VHEAVEHDAGDPARVRVEVDADGRAASRAQSTGGGMWRVVEARDGVGDRARVPSRTIWGELITLLTVWRETPAARATSSIVADLFTRSSLTVSAWSSIFQASHDLNDQMIDSTADRTDDPRGDGTMGRAEHARAPRSKEMR
jgi:hypothetical protein